MKQRAKQALTFDETFNNFINTIKSALLPGFEKVTGNLDNLFEDVNNWMTKNNIFDHLVTTGKMLADVLSFFIKNPIATLVGAAMFKVGAWIMNGRMLAMGFNAVARTGPDGTTSPAGGMSRNRMLTAGGLGIAGAGLGIGREFLDDRDSDAGKAMGVGSMALSGAAMGMLAGPWGAAVGGLIGAGIGAYQEYGGEKDSSSSNLNIPSNGIHQDFISRPGEKAIGFSSADTLIGMKKGGGIDNFVQKNETKSTNSSVNFSAPLKIEGTIKLDLGGKVVDMPLDNPLFVRELSQLLQVEITKSINGGIVSSNPA